MLDSLVGRDGVDWDLEGLAYLGALLRPSLLVILTFGLTWLLSLAYLLVQSLASLTN